MTNRSCFSRPPVRLTPSPQTSHITEAEVDRLISAVEQLRSLTFRDRINELDDRVRELIQRSERMLAMADDELAPRLRSARALLHCLYMGVAAAA